jgi:hypothetical protein
MENKRLDPRLLTIGDLFGEADAAYIVPIYQRNYAWQAEQIEQLLRDIRDAIHDGESGYFLGNLVVTELQKAPGSFEVIDGQQRLTTLYLVLSCLAESGAADKGHLGRLRYESRPRASETLRRLSAGSPVQPIASAQPSNAEDAGIHQGYNVIRQFMAQEIQGEAERRAFAGFLRTKVTVVRACLPHKTDFNSYFEVMNTRGQQLQQTDIVKARLMQRLDDDAQRACFAWIWEACADMDSYVQMSLTHRNPDLRTRIFGEDWSWLTLGSFEDLVAIRGTAGAPAGAGAAPDASLSLDAALAKYAGMGVQEEGEDLDNVRFRSTIEFPAFLLHVLEVMHGGGEEVEGHLDDKSLIKRFDLALGNADTGKSRWVQDFAFALLRCRNLFDSFVLKRQYTATNGIEGDWSLQRLLKRGSKTGPTPGYRNTFSRGSDQVEEDGDVDAATRNLLTLQSMLRVTYTSPRTMHWITRLLKVLRESERDKLTESDLAAVLRDYARGKVRSAFFSGEQARGFDIQRIVFTYLDYLLWQDRPDPEFRFSFRNSIEHFYPQSPDEQQSGAKVSGGRLHLLGNLALVSVGANSKFSNNLPNAKAHSFRNTIEMQSPKLREMAEITRRQGWGDVEVDAHHAAMVERLRSDLGL